MKPISSSDFKLALWMGLRYVRSHQRQASRIINWVSFLGLVLGIALLIVVLAVQNGLSKLTEDWVVDSVPHAILPFHFVTPEIVSDLQSTDGILMVQPFVERYALLTMDGQTQGVVVYGVDSLESYFEGGMSRPLDTETRVGLLPSFGFGTTEEKFKLTFPISGSAGVTSKSSVFSIAPTNIDLFVPGEQFGLVIVRLDDLQKIGVLEPNQVDLRITVEDPWRIESVLANFPNTISWSEEYRDYFNAVGMEKTILFVLLTFVIALASFNIVSGQAMLINSKRADIAIMQTVGAKLSTLRVAFACHGLLVVVSGILVGLLVGIGISGGIGHLFALFMEWSLMEEFDFSELRPFVKWPDLVLTLVTSLIVACLGVFRPLVLMLRIDPIEALHSPA